MNRASNEQTRPRSADPVAAETPQTKEESASPGPDTGVDCEGVTVHDMGEGFADELHRLKRWCQEHCGGVFSVEPIRDPTKGRDTGRRFISAEDTDAAAFRLSCR